VSYRFQPPEGRPRDLYRELDRRFFIFIESLPASLVDFSRQKSVYLGGESDSLIRGVEDLNPVLAGTPWLFWECFTNLSDDAFVTTAEAGLFLVLSSILMDHIVDRQANPLEQYVLLQNALNSTGVARYRELFPHHSGFWTVFEKRREDHLEGLALEVDLQHHPRQIKFSELERMAYGKVSPIIVTLTALCILTEQEGLLSPIEQSLKSIAVASQLLDDVGDWEIDVTEGHYTYFLTNLVRPDLWNKPARVARDEIKKQIKKEWADVDGLQTVLQWLERSMKSVEELNCDGWNAYVQNYKDVTKTHIREATALHILNKVKLIL
jgi:hypothetical protein